MKFFIKTFGCQMNDRDSELIAGLLIKKGYQLVNTPEAADVILFNTCSVRQHAEDKVWSEIGTLKSLKFKVQSSRREPNTEHREPIIGLIGCMAQNYQQSAFHKSPLLDLVVGPNNIDSIPDLIDTIRKEKSVGLAVGRKERNPQLYNTEYIAEKSHCNVNIMTGCNNYCSYCIVPYVRGPERSRYYEDILNEIRELVKKGVKEITLLGQNVNSYKSAYSVKGIGDSKKIKSLTPNPQPLQEVVFTELLKMVNDIEGLESFDFVTSHPKDASEELFQAMAELPKCKKFLHLPAQSGSDKILVLMNRGYTSAYYFDLVRKARRIIRGLRLTTDVMVGFPKEADDDFEATYALLRKAEFDAAYIFKYSPRPHTEAAEVPDDVPKEVKKQRNQILLDFQKNLHQKRRKTDIDLRSRE